MATGVGNEVKSVQHDADGHQARREQGDAARPARQRRHDQFAKRRSCGSVARRLALNSVRVDLASRCAPAVRQATFVPRLSGCGRVRRNCGQPGDPHAPALQLRRPRRRGPAASRPPISRRTARQGPLVLERGEGVYVYDSARQALHRGPRRPVVHRARLRQRRAGRDGARADVAALLLAPVRRPQPRAGDRAGREDQGAWRRARPPRCSSPTRARRPTTPRSRSPGTTTTRCGRPKKKKIISRKRAYHGTTVAAASLSGIPVFHADFDLPMARVLHTDCPHYWQGCRARRERGGLSRAASRATWRR